jgi:hypothetical protein
MDQNSDDAIVASLMLLLDGMTVYHAQRLVIRALSQPKKWVCVECGSDNVSTDGTVTWNQDIQNWSLDHYERDWCNECEEHTGQDIVPIDWVKPEEKDDLKPSGDP